MMPQQMPLGSVAGIETLIFFGLQIFSQVFSLFQHPLTPVPVSAAPAIITQLQATPGLTTDHQTVIAAAVNGAAAAHSATLTTNLTSGNTGT